MPGSRPKRQAGGTTGEPQAALVLRKHGGRLFYEAKFRHQGHQVKRRVGPAWFEIADDGQWQPPRGRVRPGYFDRDRAAVRAAELVHAYVTEVDQVERRKREREAHGVTFREVAAGYLDWLERVKGAKPATLRQHRSDLAEPGVAYRRGSGVTNGHVMSLLGERPASVITTSEIESLLDSVAATGVSPRSVNRVRAVVSAVFNYGMKASKGGLLTNPAAATDKRREPQRGALLFYGPHEIEQIAAALASGVHRLRVHNPETYDLTSRRPYEIGDDKQDAEAVRIAAYSGIRLGELLALRWRDVDRRADVLTISRAMSAGIEGPTKSGRVRQVPLAAQARAALDRLAQRDHFLHLEDLVFVNAIGRPIDGSALRRRYKRARDALGFRPLRWHDLRHTFGSLLVASGIDIVSVQDAMGHADVQTTSRYLHARPASERAAAFTAAFATSRPNT